jgi:hypothetical protein
MERRQPKGVKPKLRWRKVSGVKPRRYRINGRKTRAVCTNPTS